MIMVIVFLVLAMVVVVMFRMLVMVIMMLVVRHSHFCVLQLAARASRSDKPASTITHAFYNCVNGCPLGVGLRHMFETCDMHTRHFHLDQHLAIRDDNI